MTELVQKLMGVLSRLVVASTMYEKMELARSLLACKPKLTKEQRTSLEAFVALDPEAALYKARGSKSRKERAKLQQVVLEAKDPRWAYFFARDIKGADIKALQAVVLEAKDPRWIVLFIENVINADTLGPTA